MHFFHVIQMEFMRNALLASLLVAIAAGLIGTLVVANRMVAMTGGVAHAAYGGIGLGYFFQFNPLTGALFFSLSAALAMGYIRRRIGERADTLIGILWAGGMAVGILLLDLTPGYKSDLMSYLFGSIIAVPVSDLYLMAGLNIGMLLIVFLLYKELIAISFDETFAASRGLPVTALYLLLLALIACAVVILVRVVGLILVIALFTIPPAIAGRLTHSLGRIMLGASAIAGLLNVGGLVLSYYFNITSGAAIILAGVLLYAIVLLLPGAKRRWGGEKTMAA